MELITVNSSELNHEGRRRMMSMIEDNGGAAFESCNNNNNNNTTKCAFKRRRRDSGSNDQHQQKQQQQSQSQVDHNQTTCTATVPTVKRSSRFRGVSRHRWTGRFEAHLWDKGAWNPTQRKKGKQVYLGAYDEEQSAARAYDLAALKYWGTSTCTNFPVSDYANEIETMKTVTREEFLASLRRRSSGFSRGVSKYRGVARHHHNGRWEARIGRVFGNKYLYLGTYSTQEEAAHAYDIAAIEYRGINAVTNFDLSSYIRWLRPEANPPVVPQYTSTTLGNIPLTTFSNHIPIAKPTHVPTSVFRPSSYVMDDLNVTPQSDVFNTKAPISPYVARSSSTPTALGLLFKSSIFRELVEKNNQESEAMMQNRFHA